MEIDASRAQVQVYRQVMCGLRRNMNVPCVIPRLMMIGHTAFGFLFGPVTRNIGELLIIYIQRRHPLSLNKRTTFKSMLCGRRL